MPNPCHPICAIVFKFYTKRAIGRVRSGVAC